MKRIGSGGGRGNPKGADEPTRDTQLGHSTTAYDRYIQYGKLPRKKNARKRVWRRIERKATVLTPAERKKDIDANT